MNTVKDFDTINLWLNKIDIMKSFNTLNDLSNRVCVPNKTEDLDLSVFNIITGINESKTLTRHISCEYNCKFYWKKN